MVSPCYCHGPDVTVVYSLRREECPVCMAIRDLEAQLSAKDEQIQRLTGEIRRLESELGALADINQVRDWIPPDIGPGVHHDPDLDLDLDGRE